MTETEVALIRQANESRTYRTQKAILPEHIIKEMYCDMKLSADEIARRLGVGKRSVRVYLNRYGVDMRELRDAFRLSPIHAGNAPRCGPDCNFWKGGTRIRDGYRQIMMKDHPHADVEGYVFEHRWVLEQKLGRYLERHEVAHHVNGNILDNHPDNLQLMTLSAHFSMHKKQYWIAWRERRARENQDG